jgi:glycosyltransferase involved in cell wall biosynthesis
LTRVERAKISVVIPAHNEEAVIARCIETMTKGAGVGELEIIVVCNGCTDETAAEARRAGPDVQVIETTVAGKSNALNLGDRAATAFPRFYVDADIEVTVASLRLVADVLRDGGALCAAPQPRFVVDGRPWPIRGFYEIWQQMPYLNAVVVGSGVYALSESGRGRFREFPDLVGDDQFVMQQYRSDERRSVEGAEFLIHTPRSLRGLIAVRTRVYRGNRELAESASTPERPPGGRWKGIFRLVRRPGLVPAVLVYLAVNAIATARAARAPAGAAWERDDSSRGRRRSGGGGRAPIGYLMSRYPAVSHTFVMREIEALRSAGVDVRTFSVRRADPGDLLSERDREEDRQTWAIRPVGASSVLVAQLATIAEDPVAWCRGLTGSVRRQPAGLRSRLWGCFYFVEAVLLYRECRRQGIRHIHAHLANVAADVAWLSAELGEQEDGPGTWRWSFSMHGPTEFANVERFNLASKVDAASLVLCISDYARSQLMSLVAEAMWTKLHVVHMGVDLDRYVPKPPAALVSAPEHRITILCVGRLDPVKGHLVLAEALARLVRGGRPCRAVIVGAGPGESDLRAAIRRLGIESNVTLTGALGQDDLPDHYRAADIFCLPSFAEGIPVVLMEAMAMELPVVSTTIAGIPELIADGTSGLLVPPGRPDLLADALARLVDDPALRRQLGQAGRSVVERSFDARQCGRQAAELLAPWVSGQ